MICAATAGTGRRRTRKGMGSKQPDGEIKVNRNEKTITRATIELAYQRAIEMSGVVTEPKKLGVFGAIYLYPMLVRFGVING